MPLDVKALGAELAAIVAAQIGPMQKRIAELETRLATVHAEKGDRGEPGAPGQSVKGEPGADGKDGVGLAGTMIDRDGCLIVTLSNGEAKNLGRVVGKDGTDGEDGQSIKGEPGEDGKDGIGLAGAMIDRDGNLIVTMTSGEAKSLGAVVGKDGTDGVNGTNGVDGLSLDSFDMEYLADSHEITVKAVCQGRVKEVRYPAGGIRAKGFWREGTAAKAAEAWVHDGSLWIATKDNHSKPGLNDDGWIIGARKGRDGERGRDAKQVDNSPIKLEPARG